MRFLQYANVHQRKLKKKNAWWCFIWFKLRFSEFSCFLKILLQWTLPFVTEIMKLKKKIWLLVVKLKLICSMTLQLQFDFHHQIVWFKFVVEVEPFFFQFSIEKQIYNMNLFLIFFFPCIYATFPWIFVILILFRHQSSPRKKNNYLIKKKTVQVRKNRTRNWRKLPKVCL